jgi:hypothetical protein
MGPVFSGRIEYAGGRIEFEGEHFQSGTFRYAYRGTGIGGADNSKKFVVKIPKDASTFNDVSKDVMIPGIVDEYCSDFVVQISYQGKISVLEVSTKQITRPPGWALFGFIEIPSNVNLYLNRTVMIENFLEGTFRKWSNNWMYVDPVVTDINEVMQAFSHYSWARSKGKLLICDLQGVVSGSDVTLTDPVIHSIGRKYGGSDMGIYGIVAFFRRHKCNRCCRNLPVLAMSLIEGAAVKMGVDVAYLLPYPKKPNSRFLFELNNGTSEQQWANMAKNYKDVCGTIKF